MSESRNPFPSDALDADIAAEAVLEVERLRKINADLLEALKVMLNATEDSIGKRFRDQAKRALSKAGAS